MNYTANDVKALRDATGAGLLDCKKALNDTNGDVAEAEKLLKEKGLAAMAKRTDRTCLDTCTASYAFRMVWCFCYVYIHLTCTGTFSTIDALVFINLYAQQGYLVKKRIYGTQRAYPLTERSVKNNA